ncbi:hypothetical protein V8E54_014365 [Elaphomyces granulatus]
MTAVLVNDPPFPQRTIQGATVVVASIETPAVPLVVGICEADIANLDAVQGLKTRAARVVHWMGDGLWACSQLQWRWEFSNEGTVRTTIGATTQNILGDICMIEILFLVTSL